MKISLELSEFIRIGKESRNEAEFRQRLFTEGSLSWLTDSEKSELVVTYKKNLVLTEWNVPYSPPHIVSAAKKG